MDGQVLGPYRIDREIGAGGMGMVYAATLERDAAGLAAGTQVALKVVHPHLLATEGFFKRFLREAQVGRSIRHANVVRTLDCDQEFVDGKPTCFLVMEHVEGQTLLELLRELGRVPEELCTHIAREVCQALAAVHAAGVVHRDLKPENVLITPDQQVKVMDLGVALLVDEQLRLSQTGAFVGSIEYAAPEQFTGGPIDGRTDLHALGVLLYELASGTHPYRGSGYHEMMRRVCDDDTRRLGQLCPQVSPFFEEVVHTLLVKDPVGRFASAEELLEVLDHGEESAWWRKRSRRLRETTGRPLRRIRVPRETGVYGREAELARLEALFASARAGDGQVVLLEGEAGIGKSRVIDELVARLQAAGEDLDFLFGSYPPGGAASTAGAFSTAFREHFGAAGAAGWLPHLPLLVPAFDAVLRGDAVPIGSEPLTRGSLATCFVQATRALAAVRPTVVFIDDLHFAPEEARALFAELATALAGSRVLLVGATRPGVAEDWLGALARLPHTTRIALPRLGPKDLVHLLEESLRSRHLAEELCAKIAVKSDGNPFFAFEIVRGLREEQFIRQTEDGSWVTTHAIDQIEIPSSVLDLVNARVADLSDDERDMLEVASCCGFEFDPLLVADVCGVDVIPALKQLGRIEKKHRLIRSAGRRYAFDHHQVQEALYQGLHAALREHYHAELGVALERRAGAADVAPELLGGALCVDLCRHLLEGLRGEAALRYLPCAQRHLSESHLHAEGAALLERALSMPGLVQGRKRARMLLDLADVLDRPGRRPRQEECVRQAAEIAEQEDDDGLRAAAARALGEVLFKTARYEAAAATYRRALELATARGDADGEAPSLLGLGYVLHALGRPAEARAMGERALAVCRASGNRSAEANALMSLGTAFWAEGQLARAGELYEQARRIHQELGNRGGATTALGNVALVRSGQGRVQEARELAEQALTTCREIGDRAGEARITIYLGNALRRENRIAEARSAFECAYALLVEVGHRQGQASALLDLAGTFEDEERFDEAEERLQRSLELSRQIGYRRGEALAVGNLGALLQNRGRYEDSRAVLERHLELSRAIGDGAGEARALGNLASAAWYLGDTQGARDLYAQAASRSREIGAGRLLAATLEGAARLHAELGDLDRGEAYARESAEVSKAIGDRHSTAIAHVTLGTLLAQRGDETGARDALETGRDLSRDLGLAAPWTLACCRLANLPGGDVSAALSVFASNAERLEVAERGRARFLLWEATRDRAHLAAAHELVEQRLAAAETDEGRAWVEGRDLTRRVRAAWAESGAPVQPGSESATQVE